MLSIATEILGVDIEDIILSTLRRSLVEVFHIYQMSIKSIINVLQIKKFNILWKRCSLTT